LEEDLELEVDRESEGDQELVEGLLEFQGLEEDHSFNSQELFQTHRPSFRTNSQK
jgi:hypothetical protein